MKITDIRVVLHARPAGSLAVFGTGETLPMGVLRVLTDEGIEGNAFLSLPGPGPEAVGAEIVTVLKPLLIGEDPLDIGRHWRRAAGMTHFVGAIALGSLDIALWDIAGKVAGLPIHRLLGTTRTSVPVYLSSGHHPSSGDYAAEALYWKEQGWRAYKLHPARGPWVQRERLAVAADVEACTAVREATGPGMALMLDSSWDYDHSEALRVGRAIEELDYAWYEDPLPAHDLHGYLELRRHLDIPLMATEITLGGLHTMPQWIAPQRATDYLRGDVVIKGGITGLMKIAHLAEAFNMNCEVHDGYNALGNLANLHVVMAISNCDWFEVLPFNRSGDHGLEHLSYGLVQPLEIDGQGLLHAPSGPGLGIEIDWDLIDSARSGEIA
jgi:L-alanine-DL-glutamate epimerase-like enolase superfamily enzyme